MPNEDKLHNTPKIKKYRKIHVYTGWPFPLFWIYCSHNDYNSTMCDLLEWKCKMKMMKTRKRRERRNEEKERRMTKTKTMFFLVEQCEKKEGIECVDLHKQKLSITHRWRGASVYEREKEEICGVWITIRFRSPHGCYHTITSLVCSTKTSMCIGFNRRMCTCMSIFVCARNHDIYNNASRVQ